MFPIYLLCRSYKSTGRGIGGNGGGGALVGAEIIVRLQSCKNWSSSPQNRKEGGKEAEMEGGAPATGKPGG